MNVLDLMRPGTAEIEIHGALVEEESLKFLEWFEFDATLTKVFVSLLMWRIPEALRLIGMANYMAARLPASVNAKEGLAAFHILARLNELRYVDPDLAGSKKTDKKPPSELENSGLVELVSTLATRFSMEEIREMTPEFAFLSWQRIREEVALERNVVFYSTEMGYKRVKIGKDKYKLVPRKSPYTPHWVVQREGMDRPPPIVPRLVSQPGKVLDGMSGLSLSELGEVSVQTEQRRR